MPQGDVNTKEHVLAEATRLFHARGFARTSLRDLLAATGIKKGSLYFYFPSKRNLLFSVLERGRDQFMQFLDEALKGATPEQRLHRFLDTALAAHTRMGFVGGCLWGNTALEMSDNDEEFAAFVARVFHEWTQRIDAVIAEGQEAGQFRTDVPAPQLACHAVAAIEGGIMQSRLRKDEQPMKMCIDAIKTLLKTHTGAAAG